MSKQLEEKIMRLIDDYLENGLRVYVGSTMKDGRHWISFADSAEAPLIRALFGIAESIDGTTSIGTDIGEAIEDLRDIGTNIGESIEDLRDTGTDIGSAIEDLSEKRTNDADWNARDGLVHDDGDGVEVYEHPISAIAEALFEIARKKT